MENSTQWGTPAAENLFAAGTGPELSKEKAQEFHTFVTKALFAWKRARPDIGTGTISMTSCIQKPKEDNWGRFCLPMVPTWSSGMLTPVLLCILILGAILAVLWLMGRVCLCLSPTNRSSIRGAATRLRLSVWMMPWVQFCGLGYF